MAISHSDSWNRPTGGLTRYALSELGAACACGTWAAVSPAPVTPMAGVTAFMAPFMALFIPGADTEWAGRGGPWLMTAGVSAAAAVNSSSAAVTSRCAADWVAPASGTFGRVRSWLAAALTSTSTHQTSWIQASQMITDRMRRIAVTSSWLVSAFSFGIVCGMGTPTTAISAIGTPMVSAVSKMMAPMPASTSPAVRCLTWTGFRRPGMGGAISRPPGRRRCRRPGRPSPSRSR